VKHHFTVQRALRDGEKLAAHFIVEIDPERLVLVKGHKAIKARRGTANFHRGAVKIMVLVKQERRGELELTSGEASPFQILP